MSEKSYDDHTTPVFEDINAGLSDAIDLLAVGKLDEALSLVEAARDVAREAIDGAEAGEG
jgi:hypothetical protein